jgi:hypothetical protein
MYFPQDLLFNCDKYDELRKTRQYNRLSHTHSLIIVNTNYMFNSNLKYLQIYRNLLLCSLQAVCNPLEINKALN